MLTSTKLLGKVLILSLTFGLLSCAQGTIDPIDRENGFSSQDFERFFIRDREKEESEKELKIVNPAPIPGISKLILTPPPPQIGGDKTISFSVTDEVPLKDVLIELGRVAKIDIDIDPNISGGIILNAQNRSLKEVIDRIATLGHLRYTFKNDVLRFEKDSPYSKNYFVDFLSGSQLWDDVETNLSSLLGSASDDAFANSGSSTLSSNKSAGIISVHATRAQHKQITNYLDDIYRVTSAQVLIEAKVVEVTLNKEYEAGIDWAWGDSKNGIVSIPGTVSETAVTGVTTNLFGLGHDIAAIVNALEKFGTARAISSPRISAMNNQLAMLDFTENLIYFTLSSSAATSSGATTATTVQTVTATKEEVPVGVMLSIIPSINLETKEITLAVKPKLSVDSGARALDPSVDAEGNNLGNEIPIIKTREINTVAKVQSGGVLVVGGLMTEGAINEDVGVPFLSRIPVLGNLFKYSKRGTNIIETVIFIKATIVNNGAPPSSYDQNFHDNFTIDTTSF